MEDKVVLRAEYIREQGMVVEQFDVSLGGDTLITSLAMELPKHLPPEVQCERIPGDRVRVYRPDDSYMEFELVPRWEITVR